MNPSQRAGICTGGQSFLVSPFVLSRMLMLILQFECLLAQGTLMQSDKASSLNIQKGKKISPRVGTCLCNSKTSHTMNVQSEQLEICGHISFISPLLKDVIKILRK